MAHLELMAKGPKTIIFLLYLYPHLFNTCLRTYMYLYVFKQNLSERFRMLSILLVLVFHTGIIIIICAFFY